MASAEGRHARPPRGDEGTGRGRTGADRLAVLIGAVVLGAGLAAGVRAVGGQLLASWHAGRRPVIARETEVMAREVDRMVAPGAAVVYVTASADTWTCGIWQRLMPGRTVVCARASLPGFEAELRGVRSRLGVEWAVAEGPVAGRLAWASRAELSPTLVFGRLVP